MQSWVSIALKTLVAAYNKWDDEIRKDANRILPIGWRYINSDGKQEYVVDDIQQSFRTPIYGLTCALANIFMGFSNQYRGEAIDIIIETMTTYKTLGIRLVGNAGILKQSVYLYDVLMHEYKILSSQLAKIDDGDFDRIETMFNKLNKEIPVQNCVPVANDNKCWADISNTYVQMIAVASSCANFTKVYKLSIADCYGNLGYAQSMLGQNRESEKNLQQKVAFLNDIVPYDLANDFAVMLSLANSHSDIGYFHARNSDLISAVEAWNKSLKIQGDFVHKHGEAVDDTTRAYAGGIGTRNNLFVEDVISSTLCEIGRMLPVVWEMDNEKQKQLFADTLSVAFGVYSLMGKRFELALVPFFYYDLQWQLGKEDCDLERAKTNYLFLLELLDKCEKYDDCPSTKKLYPMINDEFTAKYYANIKYVLIDVIPCEYPWIYVVS